MLCIYKNIERFYAHNKTHFICGFGVMAANIRFEDRGCQVFECLIYTLFI